MHLGKLLDTCASVIQLCVALPCVGIAKHLCNYGEIGVWNNEGEDMLPILSFLLVKCLSVAWWKITSQCLNVFWCFVVLICYSWGMNKWTICQNKQTHISLRLVAVPSKCLKVVILAAPSRAGGGKICIDPGTIVVCVKELQETWSLWQSQRCDRFCGYLPTITGGGPRGVRDASTGSVTIPLPPLSRCLFYCPSCKIL